MRILAVLAALFFPTVALAAATPWQDVAPGAKLRLISSDVRRPDGTTLVGIELDMPQSYRTYWRQPGETGIPTEIDVAGSAGLGKPAIEWPYPAAETSGDYLDYVYHGPTVLPVVVTAVEAGAVLNARVVMGVCSDVCVPVQASFSLPLQFARQDLSQTIRLKQAEALTPLPWDGPTPPFAELAFDPGQGALHLTVTDQSVDPASILVSTADPTTVFDAPQKSPDGRSLLLTLRGKVGSLDWTHQPVELTFMTPKGAYEVSGQVTAPRP